MCNQILVPPVFYINLEHKNLHQWNPLIIESQKDECMVQEVHAFMSKAKIVEESCVPLKWKM